MKWALLSVWNKEGIVDLAGELRRHDVALLSSGGTGAALMEASIPFTEVSAYTGSTEMMDGRVKTLHPRIHGGLLGRRGIDDGVMKEQGILPIDLLVANLYPFEEMSEKGLPLEDLVEYIDIGGPAMIRAAAKNYRDVAVVTDPSDYPLVKDALKAGGFSADQRLLLAKRAFARTAAYDAAISNYLHRIGTKFPEVYTVQFRNGRMLRYGENPHQFGAVYGQSGIAGSEPLQGRQMSYNNYLDLSSAAGLVQEFSEPAAVVVKHNNPCGVAIGESLANAYTEARDTDPVSAYGSVVALNREVDRDLAGDIAGTFVEVVAAPAYTPDALQVFGKKENLRVLRLPAPKRGWELRSIDGGLLVQDTPIYQERWEVVTDRDPTPTEMKAMKFACRVCAHTRSNAIVFADAKKTLGIGAGQMSRVDAAKIAIEKSRFSLSGSAVASDAFLPFPDTLEVSAAAGATALVQPGGSIRDKEVIEAANRLNVAMVFTGIRHFRH